MPLWKEQAPKDWKWAFPNGYYFSNSIDIDVCFLSTNGNCMFKQNIQMPISFPTLIRKLKVWLFLQSCGFLTPWCFSFFPAQYPHEVNGTPMYLYEVATESVCESAARLLFMSIKWAKSVPAFSTLSLQDQVWPRGHWALGEGDWGGKKNPTGISLMKLNVTWENHEGQASVLKSNEEMIFISFLQ